MVDFDFVLNVLEIILGAISDSNCLIWFHHSINSIILNVFDCNKLIENTWIVHDVLVVTVSAVIEQDDGQEL